MAIGTIPPVFGDTPLTVANLAPGGLRQGQTIEARVLERVSEDVLRLATASGRLDLVLPKSGVPSLPQPGQIVHLAVGHSTSAGAPLLQFLDGPARGLTVTVRTPDLQRPGGAAPAASGTAPTQAQALPPATTVPVQPRVSPSAAALSQAVTAALARQDGAATLFAGLTALSAAPAGSLPPEVRAAASGLLALVLGPNPPTADDVRQALQRSGLFREGLLARGGKSGADMKAGLGLLRTAVLDWLSPSSAAPEANTAETWLAGEAREGDPPKRPAPPHAGSQPEGQSAARAMPAPATADEARGLALRLLDEAEQVEARILLQQAASLAPEDGSGAPDPAAPQRYAFDIPLAGPTGPSIAEIRVESDDPRQRADAPEGGRTWRVQLAFAVDPVGPLQARVGLLPGKRIAVAVWCERPEALPVLETGAVHLRAGLEAAGLDVVAVDLHVGQPPDAGQGMAPGVAAYRRVDLSL